MSQVYKSVGNDWQAAAGNEQEATDETKEGVKKDPSHARSRRLKMHRKNRGFNRDIFLEQGIELLRNPGIAKLGCLLDLTRYFDPVAVMLISFSGQPPIIFSCGVSRERNATDDPTRQLQPRCSVFFLLLRFLCVNPPLWSFKESVFVIGYLSGRERRSVALWQREKGDAARVAKCKI